MLGVALKASLTFAGAPQQAPERFCPQPAPYDVGHIPVTPRENRCLRLRDRLRLGRRVDRYLRRHPDLSGGVSVEDDRPREPLALEAPPPAI